MDRITQIANVSQSTRNIGVVTALDSKNSFGSIHIINSGQYERLFFSDTKMCIRSTSHSNKQVEIRLGDTVLVDITNVEWREIEYYGEELGKSLFVSRVILPMSHEEEWEALFDSLLDEIEFGKIEFLQGDSQFKLQLLLHAKPYFLKSPKCTHLIGGEYHKLQCGLQYYFENLEIHSVFEQYKVNVVEKPTPSLFDAVSLRIQSNATELGISIYDIYMDQFIPYLNVPIDWFRKDYDEDALQRSAALWSDYVESLRRHALERVRLSYNRENHEIALSSLLQKMTKDKKTTYLSVCRETYLNLLIASCDPRSYPEPIPFNNSFGESRGYWTSDFSDPSDRYREEKINKRPYVLLLPSTGFPIFFKPSNSLLARQREISLEIDKSFD